MSNQTSRYDSIGDFYLNFVSWGLASEQTLFWQTSQFLLNMLAITPGQNVLDLCCGEGHLSRALAKQGANVVGIDLSEHNLNRARATDSEAAIRYQLDDAQHLASLADNQFDLVACKMALMDIPDVEAAFKAVARVLVPGGRFVMALLHPCFETPFQVPHEPVEQTATGRFKHHRVQRYFDEGHWSSGGNGVRGHVGAHHRTLSTYLNGLLATGFTLNRLEEPQFTTGQPDSLEQQWHQNIAKILYIDVSKPQ